MPLDLICLEASKNSPVLCCPRFQKYKPDRDLLCSDVRLVNPQLWTCVSKKVEESISSSSNRLPPISADRPRVMARTKYSFQSNLEIRNKCRGFTFIVNTIVIVSM